MHEAQRGWLGGQLPRKRTFPLVNASGTSLDHRPTPRWRRAPTHATGVPLPVTCGNVRYTGDMCRAVREGGRRCPRNTEAVNAEARRAALAKQAERTAKRRARAKRYRDRKRAAR